MEKEIDKLVSEFEGGTLTRRDLVRGMTMLSATTVAAMMVGVTRQASADEVCVDCPDEPMDSTDPSKCTTTTPDVTHHLVERLINSRFKRSGQTVFICTGQEVWPTAADHKAWLFDGDNAFIKLRANAANSGSLKNDYNTHVGKPDGDTGAQRGHIKQILDFANKSGFQIFEETQQVLYRALQAKIKAEQDSHARAAIKCFALWLDGKDSEQSPADPSAPGAICSKHVCDGDMHGGRAYSYHDCHMEYCKIPPRTQHEWY